MVAPPLLPDYGGACLSNVVPGILGRHRSLPPWMPEAVAGANQVVLLVLDGLGWEQLQRAVSAPTLRAMGGGPISTVVPSTTATAMTSLTLGVPPGEHGVLGYRMRVHGDVLNVLRWSTSSGDARRHVPPVDVQPLEPFLGLRPAAVTKAEFERSGFSGAHLRGVRFTGWRVPSSLVVHVRTLLRSGEPLVFAYYDGVDKVAHEYGLREHYDAELTFADGLVAQLCEVLVPGATLVVTSDHGQVHVSEPAIALRGDVLAHVALQSGEGRFRWLHARPGQAAALLDAAREAYGHQAWVQSRAEVMSAQWFGPRLSEATAARLGDVALVARADVSFDDPDDTGPFELIGRHGSVTAAEMLVPLLAARA